MKLGPTQVLVVQLPNIVMFASLFIFLSHKLDLQGGVTVLP